MLLLGDYAESPKGLKVGDRVKVDVAAEQLEELQRQRDAWDPELAKVISALICIAVPKSLTCQRHLTCFSLGKIIVSTYHLAKDD